MRNINTNTTNINTINTNTVNSVDSTIHGINREEWTQEIIGDYSSLKGVGGI